MIVKKTSSCLKTEVLGQFFPEVQSNAGLQGPRKKAKAWAVRGSHSSFVGFVTQVLAALRDGAAGRVRWPEGSTPSTQPGRGGLPAPRGDGQRLQALPAEERRRVLRERLVRKFAAREPVYDNCRMLSQVLHSPHPGCAPGCARASK